MGVSLSKFSFTKWIKSQNLEKDSFTFHLLTLWYNHCSGWQCYFCFCFSLNTVAWRLCFLSQTLSCIPLLCFSLFNGSDCDNCARVMIQRLWMPCILGHSPWYEGRRLVYNTFWDRILLWAQTYLEVKSLLPQPSKCLEHTLHIIFLKVYEWGEEEEYKKEHI